MPDLPTRPRATPPTIDAQLMRDAADLIGSEALAILLDVAPRTVYMWMDGKRTVRPGVLSDTRRVLIERRQKIGDLVQRLAGREAEIEATVPA